MRWIRRGGSLDGVPRGRLLLGDQFSYELLRLAHGERTQIFMSVCVDDVTDVANIGAWDGYCESVCV